MSTKTRVNEESSIPSPLPLPRLKTRRLDLRPLEARDEESVQELAAAIEIASTTLSFPHPYPPGAARAWLEKKQESYDKGEELVLAIEENGSLIGTMGFMLNHRDDSAELGYWIGKPYWGKGYASEAAIAMIRFGFEKLGLHRIQAQTMARNPASAKVLEKADLRHEGLLHGSLKKWGVYEDVNLYAAVAGEWRV